MHKHIRIYTRLENFRNFHTKYLPESGVDPETSSLVDSTRCSPARQKKNPVSVLQNTWISRSISIRQPTPFNHNSTLSQSIHVTPNNVVINIDSRQYLESSRPHYFHFRRPTLPAIIPLRRPRLHHAYVIGI